VAQGQPEGGSRSVRFQGVNMAMLLGEDGGE